MKQSLEIYRSFWLILPKQICQSNEISISNDQICWTGNSLSYNNLQQIHKNHYDKPLDLRLQWLLKEIQEKSRFIDYIHQTTTKGNSFLNLTKIDFDDYPIDNDFDYSDYGYEDSKEESLSTTIQSSTTTTTTFNYNENLIDEKNTVSYYDYGEQDVYTDDEFIEISSTQQTTTTTAADIVRTPSYHHRQPIIWNININNDDNENDVSTKKYNSSQTLKPSSFLSLLLLLLFIFILI